MKSRFRSLASIATTASLALPCGLEAATLVSQWDWNSLAGFTAPSAGLVLSGTYAGYGQGTPPSLVTSIVYNGTPTDPGKVTSGTSYNRALTVNPPLLSTANRSVGILFGVPTTGMAAGEAVKLSWSQTVGFRSSRYWQVLVSTTGTAGPFSAPSDGTGSTINQFVSGYTSGSSAISGNASVTVSPNGLVDFRTISGNFINFTVTTTGTVWSAPLDAGWVDDISLTLPTGQGYENNPNFSFALVALWDPNSVATSGTTGLVSSFAGTNSTDAVNGYNRAAASGGSMRLDKVSVYSVAAVPEPTAWILLGASALFGSVMVRRRA